MPYTFAHPGYSLFLFKKIKRYVGTTGLVVGSIMPDADILFRFSNSRIHIYSYNLVEVFLMILPMSILAGLYFHLVIKPVLIEKIDLKTLQMNKEKWMPDYWKWFKKHFSKEILGVLVAVYLHIFLDLISHWNAFYFAAFMHGFVYPHPDFFNAYYLFAMYFPLLLFTLIGFYFLYLVGVEHGWRLNDLFEFVFQSLKKHCSFWVSFALMSMMVAYFKFLVGGLESGFAFDYIMIHLTSGIIITFFLLPTLYYVYDVYYNKFRLS